MSDDPPSVQDTLATSDSDIARESPRIDHELYFSNLALRLLIILCLGALASFPLASQFLFLHSLSLFP